MELTGGCQCGAVRYRVNGEPRYVALCHCSDCRKSAGAPVVGWGAFAEADFAVEQGQAATYSSNGTSIRSFCPTCGSGIFFRNAETLPGIVDIQLATLDDPDALPPGVQIQVADRIGWMETAHTLPAFQRYPGMPED